MNTTRFDAEAPAMPDLIAARHGFHHTADSALATLERLGVSPERITIRKAGRGWAALRVVEQRPAAGASLTPDVAIELAVEGDGLFYHLPVGMREGSAEGEVGTREIASLFDDPIEKAAHFAREGGFYFDLRPDNPRGCARWIRLFGLAPDEWPRERWYKLAILLPRLRHLVGRESGLWMALQMLLDLEVSSIGWRPRRALLVEAERSRLGESASRLGVDLIAGDGIDDEAALRITLRAETLEEYRRHRAEEGQQRIEQVMRLVAPYHWVYEIEWLVGDVNRAPRLGIEIENAVLGVNSHLGGS